MKRSNTRSRTPLTTTGRQSTKRRQNGKDLACHSNASERTGTKQPAWHDTRDDSDGVEVDIDEVIGHQPLTSTGAAEARRRIEMLREEHLLRESLSDVFEA